VADHNTPGFPAVTSSGFSRQATGLAAKKQCADLQSVPRL